jgi:hypothetical protein
MTISDEIAALPALPVADLREKYAALFGEATRVHNRTWLLKRLAWRMQALAEGGLGERARQRAAQLANDADLRLSAPQTLPHAAKPAAETASLHRDPRLPAPGTHLTRQYTGRKLLIEVLERGFQYKGQVYRSLSAVAKAITGCHCNGYLFFRLGQEGGRP